MKSKIEQKAINAAAWSACDTFRGVVDPAQYKDYILVMLFLKYISDTWKDHYEDYKKRYGDDDTRILRKLERERFILPMVTLTKRVEVKNEKTGEISTEEVSIDAFRATFDSLVERKSANNIGEIINIVFAQIEESNKAKLGGVFRNIDFNSEANLGKTKDRNRRLNALIEDFDKTELNMSFSRVSEDVIGNTYMYLIERFGADAGKKAGEFYTPHQITQTVARLAAPKAGDRICDPTCGSGGLLIEAGKLTGSHDFALFGQESNGSTWALCRMNMFLHSFDSARIEWCDTINSPQLVEGDSLMKFNCIVANPPFSLDKWGAEHADADRYNRFWRGVPPKSKGDWAFITHMIETALEKEGRVSIVVPHGVLFRGAAEGRIREAMIRENLLDAVIGLPGNLFPSTSIPVAVLIFDRSREDGGANADKKDILFIDASRDFVPGKNQNSLGAEHMDKIVETYQSREVIGKYSHLATLEEVAENNYNLNIPRYVDTFEEEEEIDVVSLRKEIEELEAELVMIQAKMKEQLKQLGV